MLYKGCCHGDAIDQSFCFQLISRKQPKHQIPPAAKATRLFSGANTLCAVQEAAFLFLFSEDDILLQLTALCEGCACLCLKSCILLTLRGCVFSDLSPIKAWEFSSAAWNRHVTHIVHSETDVSKYKLHPLTLFGPLWEVKNPKTLLWRLSAAYQHSQLDLSLWVPGASSQYSKVGALELSATLAAAAKPHVRITPQSARHKMFGFWVY